MVRKKSVNHRKSTSSKHVKKSKPVVKKVKKHIEPHHPDFVHSRFVKFLMYTILFLVLALALLVFFSPSLVQYEAPVGEEIVEVDSFLKMNGAVCTWESDSFSVCANVNWDGANNDYLKCGFGGEVDDRRMISSPVTCCGNVGDESGIKLVRSFLHNEAGEIYADDSLTVECKGKPKKQVTAPLPSLTTTYQKSFWFIAKTEGISSSSTDSEYIDFPGRVKSCEVVGKWVTQERNGGDRQTDYCGGAEGVFYGAGDLFEQNVFSDPGNFWWAGQNKRFFDPEGELHQGEGIFAYLCDEQYISGPRHYVKGKFTGFQTEQLRLDWEYFSNYPKPKVDVFIDLKCQIY
ncbi:hypothetical protein HOH10_02105 [Candidatus Woesearchaeota archaeon]|jgi:hypothetical protein|nr:hypothetical protein [Candidatus Woesearchaeota archaeon]MBT5043139.1 hypothetical protein [Candidatus Woesearchaeota archaeon]MBT7148844.1 hypothetical protein [Candidatus Woesearchaeota archaeon]